MIRLLALVLAIGSCSVPTAQTTEVGATDSVTETERAVRQIIEQDGIHVVRFWNPSCGNSLAELRNGLYQVVEANPEVTFTFVTVWNDEEIGEEILDRYLIPGRVTRLVQADEGPSEDRGNRRYAFLGVPVTWTPSSRIYHRNGVLAYAFNYGELSPSALQQAIDDTRSDWEHD